jgi:hypothetical protein
MNAVSPQVGVLEQWNAVSPQVGVLENTTAVSPRWACLGIECCATLYGRAALNAVRPYAGVQGVIVVRPYVGM